ncbi:hypothetical protein JYU34_012530 [Plutella xylostella]|uniref:Uncharacterized protein n=1 Tax=Plutella xylostella TaxID=51655 RepID=A0ABQ7QBJ2_PLUXY|nr:hypothetical protein JYU34_012530 [Plutella xylostella]
MTQTDRRLPAFYVYAVKSNAKEREKGVKSMGGTGEWIWIGAPGAGLGWSGLDVAVSCWQSRREVRRISLPHHSTRDLTSAVK